MAETKYAYDEIPYLSMPDFLASPDYIGAVARLYGLHESARTNYRVLDLCCGTAIHLISCAMAQPKCHFVGIDLSSEAINEGQRIIDELGIGNARLECRNVLELTENYGVFEYIIFDGAFSWFSSEQQQELLAVVRRLLSPRGIVFIRHTVLPGWFDGKMIRDIMMIQTGGMTDVGRKVRLAREHFSFLANVAPAESIYGQTIKNAERNIKEFTDAELVHQILSENKTPLYFSQFVEKTEHAGLKFLCESELKMMSMDLMPKQFVEEVYKYAATREQLEQQIDYLTGRTIRKTLLCPAEKPVIEKPQLIASEELFVASPVRSAAQNPNWLAVSPETFMLGSAGSFTTADPACKLALGILMQEWPQFISVQQLVEKVKGVLAERLGHYEFRQEEFCRWMLKCITMDMVYLTVSPPKLKSKAGNKPRVYSLARYLSKNRNELKRIRQDDTDENTLLVFNMYHRGVMLNTVQSEMIVHMDGTADRKALCELLSSVTGQQDGIAERLDNMLNFLARSALIRA